MTPAGVGQLVADHVGAVQLVRQLLIADEGFMHALQLLPLRVADVRGDERHEVEVASAGLEVPEGQRPVRPQRHQRYHVGGTRGEALK